MTTAADRYLAAVPDNLSHITYVIARVVADEDAHSRTASEVAQVATQLLASVVEGGCEETYEDICRGGSKDAVGFRLTVNDIAEGMARGLTEAVAS
jgi:hypothetical protein